MFLRIWLAVKARAIRNLFLDGDYSLKAAGSVITLLVGMFLSYSLLNWMLAFVHSKGLPAFEFTFIFLSFTLLILLPLVFYSALISALSYLFQKEEVHFYFSLPVKRDLRFSGKIPGDLPFFGLDDIPGADDLPGGGPELF